MQRRQFLTLGRQAAIALLLLSPPLLALSGCQTSDAASTRHHKLVIHVGRNNATEMHSALTFARNVSEHYQQKGEQVDIKILAIGGGIDMFLADSSNYERALSRLKGTYPNVDYLVCGNSLKAAAEKSRLDVKDLEILDQVDIVAVGVVTLMELQRQGYAYIRP